MYNVFIDYRDWFLLLQFSFSCLKVLAEGSPDEVFAQVSDIFEHLPNRKTTSLHDYDVTFITGMNVRDTCFFRFPFKVLILGFVIGKFEASEWCNQRLKCSL